MNMFAKSADIKNLRKIQEHETRKSQKAPETNIDGHANGEVVQRRLLNAMARNLRTALGGSLLRLRGRCAPPICEPWPMAQEMVSQNANH